MRRPCFRLLQCCYRLSITPITSLCPIRTGLVVQASTSLLHSSAARIGPTSDAFELAARRFAKYRRRRTQPLLPSRGSLQSRLKLVSYVLFKAIDLEAVRKDRFFSELCPEILPITDSLCDALYMRLGDTSDKDTVNELYLFADGMLVLWDVDERRTKDIIDHLMLHGTEPYSHYIVEDECDWLHFELTDKPRSIIKDDVAQVSTKPQLGSDFQEEESESDGERSERKSRIVRFVFSHALANSVKLGTLEAQLMAIAGSGNRSLAAINDALTRGRVPISKREALMSLASLISIRHEVNLRADLLSPDIYWERSDLDDLYQRLSIYFNIAQRLRALNDQLDYCEHTLTTVDGLLSHRQSTRLEWIIIVLIAIEVVLELCRWRIEHKENNERRSDGQNQEIST